MAKTVPSHCANYPLVDTERLLIVSTADDTVLEHYAWCEEMLYDNALGEKYIEVREYKRILHCFRFHFITWVYYDYIEYILQRMLTDPTPD